MNAVSSRNSAELNASYEESRFNALQHGILSRHAVLSWENRDEYRALLDALIAEHAPRGPTEEHLVEELVGIIWRKGRLRLAEAAVYREQLRKSASSGFEESQIASAALLPALGKHKSTADVPRAIAATSSETAQNLRDIKRDQATTQRAFNILITSEPDAYNLGLAALAEDARLFWLECLADKPTDGLRYEPTANALSKWIRRNWAEWFEAPIAELKHRDAIRDQAIGSAYATQRLEIIARYEVHLDRKLERTLSMLIRLRDLRSNHASI